MFESFAIIVDIPLCSNFGVFKWITKMLPICSFCYFWFTKRKALMKFFPVSSLIRYTNNYGDRLVDLIWRLLGLQIKCSYNNIYLNFAIWEMGNYRSVLLYNLSVSSDLLPVHRSCYWSACYLLPLCWTLVFWHNQWGSLLYFHHDSKCDKVLESLLGLGRGSAQWCSRYDAGVAVIVWE